MSNEKKAAPFSEPLWNTETVADYIGKSTKSLENDRLKGAGIPFIRIGRTVRYDPAIVRRYLANKTVRTTDSDAAA
jgi:hypothetical protein